MEGCRLLSPIYEHLSTLSRTRLALQVRKERDDSARFLLKYSTTFRASSATPKPSQEFFSMEMGAATQL